MNASQTLNFEAVGRAFSKQSEHYDVDDHANPILKEWRQQVYTHINQYLNPCDRILELNSGTGIDAIHFAEQGYVVRATDISTGMIAQLRKKITQHALPNISCTHLSYEELDKLTIEPVDYVFSNFGGLNCSQDLSNITRYLPALLKPGAFITFVIMPSVCPWELLGIFKGHGKKAFRRLSKKGTLAHLEGEYFKTYYYSLTDIKRAFGKSFKFIASEGLGAISPPPSKSNVVTAYPKLYKTLRRIDKSIGSRFPFNRWADHLIVTFQYIR